MTDDGVECGRASAYLALIGLGPADNCSVRLSRCIESVLFVLVAVGANLFVGVQTPHFPAPASRGADGEMLSRRIHSKR